MEIKIDLTKQQEKQLNKSLALSLMYALEDSDVVNDLADAAIASHKDRIAEIIDELMTDRVIVDMVKKRIQKLMR